MAELKKTSTIVPSGNFVKKLVPNLPRQMAAPMSVVSTGGSWLSQKRNTFILVVVLPCILAAIYYSFIVSGQYITEARMIVRTIGVSEQFSESETREGRSMIGGDSLTQDAYIVANYLESQELVKILDARIGLSALFSKGEIDHLSRLSKEASSEEVHAYWNSQIDTYVDGPSGIIIFTVRAFSAEDSFLIMETALEAVDDMIGRISDRAKTKLVERVEGELIASLISYEESLNNLRQYQNQTGILDPRLQARLSTAIIGELVERRIGLSVQLEATRSAGAGDSALARQLSRNIDAIDSEIKVRQDSLASNATGSNQLSETLVEFARLETNRVVEQAIFKANARNLDTAKSAALQRTTFVSVFSKPTLADEALYPKRLSAWLIVAIGMLTLWTTGTLIWMSIQDHRV